MKEITIKEAKDKNLKLIGNFLGNNLSRTILILERCKENKKIRYYSMNFIALNEETHNGNIFVSFWK
jgi:hypothetical protein